MQHLEDRPIGHGHPGHPSIPGRRLPGREGQPLLLPPHEHLPCRPQLVELLEHPSDGVGHRLVGALGDLARPVDVVARRQHGEDLAAAGLRPAGLHHPVHGAVPLELAHLPADPEHQAIRGRGRVVDPVLVRDQRRRPAAQVHEVVPVGVVARQPRHLQAHHDPHLGPCHRPDETRKPRPRLRGGAAAALVLVEDHDLPFAPPQRSGLLGEAVLPPLALHVLAHLLERGLADVDERRTLEVLGADLRPVQALAAHDVLAPCRGRGACAARAISRAYCSITARRARFGSRRHSAPRRSPRRSRHACLGMGSLLRDPHMSHQRLPASTTPRRCRASTISNSARIASTLKTASGSLVSAGAPSASVHALGSLMASPPSARTTSWCGPVWRTSNVWPCSG